MPRVSIRSGAPIVKRQRRQPRRRQDSTVFPEMPITPRSPTNETGTTASLRSSDWSNPITLSGISSYTSTDHRLFFKSQRFTREREEQERRRRRRAAWFAACCPCCSPCCCLLCGLFAALLLTALAVLIILLIPTTRTTSTTTTSTTSTSTTSTSTSSTSTSTTSATTTTSTSTTSTSTSSTSTSATSISTTSETTTSATTLSTTSITTTSTSTTTQSATTATTTATITSNTCTSGWTGVTTLYHCGNCANIMPYSYQTYTYVAIGTQTRLSFAFREDTGCFSVDNVSVRSTAAPSVELISNGGFETGTLSSWTYCNPSGAAAAGAVLADVTARPCISYTLQSQTGAYFYYDGAVGNNDYLSQKFNTIIGQTYTISFWLYNEYGGGTSTADILLTI